MPTSSRTYLPLGKPSPLPKKHPMPWQIAGVPVAASSSPQPRTPKKTMTWDPKNLCVFGNSWQTGSKKIHQWGRRCKIVWIYGMLHPHRGIEALYPDPAHFEEKEEQLDEITANGSFSSFQSSAMLDLHIFRTHSHCHTHPSLCFPSALLLLSLHFFSESCIETGRPRGPQLNCYSMFI